MADEKKIAPAGLGPVSANEVGIGKGNENIEILDESVIIYRSWFECLKEQGVKKFAQAMIALLSFAFYGVDVKSHGLPRQLEAIIETFTPLIITNRKKRKGGDKGKEYGGKGGRPSQNGDSQTPKGLSNDTPKDSSDDKPKGFPYNVNVNANATGTDSDNVSVNDTAGLPTAHTDYNFYVFVFFFRNIRHPERQARKFTEFYTPTNWRLPGGEYIATDEQRIALAQRWEIRDDTADRFAPEDLSMWKELYDIAPADVKQHMLANSIKFKRTEKAAIIAGPQAISDWIEININKTSPIVRKWMGARYYSYVPAKK